jgi:hypothetical protein
MSYDTKEKKKDVGEVFLNILTLWATEQSTWVYKKEKGEGEEEEEEDDDEDDEEENMQIKNPKRCI